MKIAKAILILATPVVFSACGSANDFEWFPDPPDTSAPSVSATIFFDNGASSKPVFLNGTTHVATLPAYVTFSATESATIYYTTNGADPTLSSAFVGLGVPGPTITTTNTILKFFGIDQSENKNASSIFKSTIVSP